LLGVALLLRPGLAAVLGVEDQPGLAADPAVLGVGETNVVELPVGRRLDDVPGPTRVAGLEDLAAVADHQGALGGERLHIEEAIADHRDLRLRKRRQLDFSMATDDPDGGHRRERR
jgi:hypothetical protein